MLLITQKTPDSSFFQLLLDHGMKRRARKSTCKNDLLVADWRTVFNKRPVVGLAGVADKVSRLLNPNPCIDVEDSRK